ncbi:hypothetical protein EJ08DRAFT_737966 [Tothia fuscella]|uniref:Uncharacterized protein n=1 Tax=Tothia fuscella TaxID=1048955 RepID=A0A9P4NHX1_9PEZI|nr:hypothetical protein EJ08DRAFT_737966 [Tothia fuscella]
MENRRTPPPPNWNEEAYFWGRNAADKSYNFVMEKQVMESAEKYPKHSVKRERTTKRAKPKHGVKAEKTTRKEYPCIFRDDEQLYTPTDPEYVVRTEERPELDEFLISDGKDPPGAFRGVWHDRVELLGVMNHLKWGDPTYEASVFVGRRNDSLETRLRELKDSKERYLSMIQTAIAEMKISQHSAEWVQILNELTAECLSIVQEEKEWEERNKKHNMYELNRIRMNIRNMRLAAERKKEASDVGRGRHEETPRAPQHRNIQARSFSMPSFQNHQAEANPVHGCSQDEDMHDGNESDAGGEQERSRKRRRRD